jgi:hypothetical protein
MTKAGEKYLATLAKNNSGAVTTKTVIFEASNAKGAF